MKYGRFWESELLIREENQVSHLLYKIAVDRIHLVNEEAGSRSNKGKPRNTKNQLPAACEELIQHDAHRHRKLGHMQLPVESGHPCEWPHGHAECEEQPEPGEARSCYTVVERRASADDRGTRVHRDAAASTESKGPDREI